MTIKVINQLTFICVALLHLFSISATGTEKRAEAFAFVGSQYIITVEPATAHSFVVNFINMSDFVIVTQPSEFIYRAATGRFYNGQVYEVQHTDARGEDFRYAASVLLKGYSFTGLTIVGAFHEQDQIEELSIRIGAKRFYLQSMDKTQFEQLAAKVEELDLKNPNSREALQEANIEEMGNIKITDGTSEWDQDWQNLLMPDGTNPPKIIERPEITPSEEGRRSRAYGKVKLAGLIDKNGAIQSLKVIKGLGRGLDERAIEAVKNSWVFLPATKNGEVLDTSITFDVDFPPPQKN